MMRWVLVSLLLVFAATDAQAAGEHDHRHLRKGVWSFEGVFGLYDRAALRRGLQVYNEVCAACHGLKYLYYRNLGDEGGPQFGVEEIKALAAEKIVEDGPDSEGEMFERPALPRDLFVSPFANDEAARAANGGALPPDLSLMVKARLDGANYVYSLLLGYKDPPAGVSVPEGQYYNEAFGHAIAMAPPLTEEAVEYADGTPATLEQMAHDVTTFLAWAAEPKLEQRKRIGFKVLIYLLLLAGVLYLATRRKWAQQK